MAKTMGIVELYSCQNELEKQRNRIIEEVVELMENEALIIITFLTADLEAKIFSTLQRKSSKISVLVFSNLTKILQHTLIIKEDNEDYNDEGIFVLIIK